MRRLKVFFAELSLDLKYTFGRWVLPIMGGVSVLLLGFVFVIGNLVYPYQPIKVYEYKTAPAEVCPGGDVAVETEWEIGDELRTFDVTYRWKERDDPTTVFGGKARFEDIEARPRMKQESPLVRPAPLEPGLWKLITSYDAFGMRFGMLVRQDLDNVMSKDFVRVLKANDKKCEGSQRVW